MQVFQKNEVHLSTIDYSESSLHNNYMLQHKNINTNKTRKRVS